MALARPEQIMQAVVTKVTGLTTTGAHVFRGRVYNIEQSKLPALTITMGADNPSLDGATLGELASVLEVVITAHVRESVNQVDTVLNQIRNEVHAAVMADATLGLGFVTDIEVGGADEPRIDVGDMTLASMDIHFGIQYRSSWTDISA